MVQARTPTSSWRCPSTTRPASWQSSIAILRAFLDESFPLETRIVIVDNASTDGTWAIAQHLADTLPGVDAVHLDRKGRGLALRAAWSRATAPVVAYMDVDLATGLDALLPLVAPLVSGHSDIAIGTRLAPGAHVVRGAQRELLSRGYNLLVRVVLGSSCSDAQCGFKAMRREAAVELLPLIEDDEWFFDTELLVTAQRIGLRIPRSRSTGSTISTRGSTWFGLRGRTCGASSAWPGPLPGDGPPRGRPGRAARRGLTEADRRSSRSGELSPFANHRVRRFGVGRHQPGLRRRAAPLRRGRCGEHGGLPRPGRRPASRPRASTWPTPWPSWSAAWATPLPTAG